jgi:hypothetical protein
LVKTPKNKKGTDCEPVPFRHGENRKNRYLAKIKINYLVDLLIRQRFGPYSHVEEFWHEIFSLFRSSN